MSWDGIIVSNSGFYGNTAGAYGGAVFTSSTTSIANNCTFADNRALAGMFLAGPNHLDTPFVVANCIVDNGDHEVQTHQASVTLEYSAIRDYSPPDNNAGSIVWGPGNIDADPCFVSPGCWDPNGTPYDPNDDHYVMGDYHLKSEAGRWDTVSGSWVHDDVTSPCIDAGDPNAPIMHEPFANGGIVNMGAYGGTAEASKAYFGNLVCETIITGDINGDCRVNLMDLTILLNHWLEIGVFAEVEDSTQGQAHRK